MTKGCLKDSGSFFIGFSRKCNIFFSSLKIIQESWAAFEIIFVTLHQIFNTLNNMKRFFFFIVSLIAISLTINVNAQTCKTPENLHVTSLTKSSATLSWDLSVDGDMPTSYFFKLSTASGVVSIDSNLVAPSQTYTITNLAASTTYIVELGSTCNATQSGISELATYSFVTSCDAQAAPYNEDFDLAPPQCTYSENATWSDGGRSGKCMMLTTSVSESAHLVFPELNLTSDNVEVGIWMKANSTFGGNVPVMIGIVTDPSDIDGSFEPIYNGQLTTTTWTEVRMNTSATQLPATPTTMIAVVFPAGLDRSIYIDDVSIHVIPTCIRPEDFTITNVGATSATFSWTTTNAQSVKLYLSSDVDTRTITATTNPYTITDLVPNTDYSFRIRALCSATDSSEMSPTILTAHTECVTAEDALFMQGFETLTVTNALPDCWHEGWFAKPTGNTKAFPFALTTDRAHSGLRSMTLVQQTDGSLAYLSSQALPFDQSGKYTLSVWVYRQEASATQAEGLKFWVGPHPDDTTGATLLGYIPRHYLATPVEHTANEWYNYEFIINATGDKYIIVEGISQNGAPIYFDDLGVRLTPSCFKVSNVVFDAPTYNSIGMSWTRGMNEQQWIVSYSLNDGSFITDTVSSPSITIQNLAPATTYSIEGTIVSYCGAGDMSDPVSFNSYFVTTCEPLATLPYSCGFEQEELSSAANPMPLCWSRWNDAPGSNNIYPQASTAAASSHSGNGFLRFMPVTSSTTDYGEHQVAVLPCLNTTLYPINTLRLIMYGQATTINPAPMVTVGVMTDPTDFSTFTATDSFYVGTTEYLRYEARFANYAGNGSYIAFYTKRVQTSFLSLNIDDIRLEPVPACPDIEGAGVTVSDISDHNAKITVTDLTANTWSYAYGVAGTPLPACTVVDTLTYTSVFLNNLSPNTTYVIYARRRCGYLFGSWSEAVTFRTACGAFTVPYSDDFETQPTGELAGCYYVAADNQHLDVFADNSNTYNHTPGGTKGLSSSHDAQTPAAATLVENMTVGVYLHLESGHSYEISIYAKTRNYSNNYRLSFVNGTSSSNLNVISTSNVNSTSWNRFSAYYTPLATGDCYLGIMTSAINDATQYAPYLDDISIREVSCVPPTDAIVSQLGSTSATINLTSQSTTWDVAVSSTPITGSVVGDIYRDTINSTSFTLQNLAVNTTYYYTIRTICGQNNASDWMTPQSFHTRCTTVSVPYSEGFEDASAVTCWIPQNGVGNVSQESSVHNSGYSSMRIEASSAVSPEFNVTTFAPYMLTGWVYANTDSTTLSIGVMSNPDDASSFEQLEAITIYQANKWTEFTVYFDTLNSPDYAEFFNARYLAISTGNNTVFVDDLNLITAPSCNRPVQGVISSASDHSVTADWTETGSATQWLLYATAQSGATTSQVVTSHPYTLTGLATSTNYSLFIRSICSAGDTSIAYKIGDFYTECGYIIAPYTEDFESFPVDVIPTCWDNSASDHTITYTNHPHYLWGVYSSRGNKSIRMYDAQSSTGDAIIISPEIILTAGSNYDFRYDYCHQSSTGDLVVGIRRHRQPSFSTIAVHESNGMTDGATPSQFITNSYGLQAYVGDTVQFMFYGQTHYGVGSTWVDNVRVRQLSSCSEVSAVSVQDVTANTMDIAFADTAVSHTMWQYAVVFHGRSVANVTPVDITAKTFTVTGLTPATNYDVYVRAVCSAGDYSTWNMVTQKTPALPAVLPYITDFSNPSQNEEWQQLGNGANNFVFGNDSHAVFGNGICAMYVSDGTAYGYNFSSSSITGIARLFSFDETTYNIEFDWKCSGGQYSFDYTRFFLAPSYADLLPTYTTSQVYQYYSWPDNLIPLDGDTYHSMVEGGIQHVSEIIDMTGRAGEYYLVYVWVNDGSGGNNYPLSVGNLSVSELTCEPVVNLAIDENSISHNRATATFNNPNVGSDIRWAVSTSTLITDTVASGVVQGSSVTVSNLQPSTRYRLFVRAECSSISHSPWVSVPFTTECAAISTFPVTESFEDLTFPPTCWTTTTLRSVTESHGVVVNGTWIQESRNTHSGNKSAGFEGTQNTSALLATPAIAFDPTREYHVSFWLMQSGSSWNDDEVNVYVGPNADSKDGATLMAHYVIYNSSRTNNSLMHFDLDFPAGLDGDYHVLFEAIDVSNGYIYLDDVTVDIYPPCRNLTTLPAVVATTSTTATVAMPIGIRSSIKYGIAPYSTSPQPSQIFATQTTTTGETTFTGLTPGTSYSLFARGYCSDGDSTAWTTAVTITTKTNDCFAPENIHTDGQVSDVAATISWNTVPDVTAYQCILIGGTSNDTSTVTQTQVSYSSLTPVTDYTLMVRGFCGANDTTDWSTFTFRTISTPATLPYTTGFEPTDDNSSWQSYPSGYQSNFIIGRDAEAHNSGARGLYISSDGQSYSQVAPTNPTPQYGVNLYGVTYYTRTIYFPAAGNYEVSFDWKCNPSAGLSYEAYGRTFVAPATATLPVDDAEYLRNLPEGSYPIGNNMDKSSTWQHTSSIITLDEPQYMNLVFMWVAINTNGYCSPEHVSETPLAIDNVSVNEVSCLPASSVVALSVYDTTATIMISHPDPVDIEYALMTTYSLDNLDVMTLSSTSLRDTLVLTGLQTSTDYYLVVRQRCSATDSSSWQLLNFRTTATPAALPYVCDFEDDEENGNWLYTQNQPNFFTIGTGTSFGGTHSLYITDDGSTYNYDVSALTFCYAHRIISLPAGLYEYSYDWQCNGEDKDDGARIFIIPADVLLFPGSWLYGLSWASVPKNAIALDEGFMHGTTAYNRHSGSFTIAEEKLYNIVVAWRSGTNGGSNPPISIDNLTISQVTCIPPTISVIGGALGENSASFAITNVNENSSLVYALSTSDNIADALYYDTVAYRAQDTITLTGLSASTSYHIFVRSLCSDDDISFWTPLLFKTLCGEITQFPYTEGFENLTATNGYVANAASAFCWSAINAVSAKPYYNISIAQHAEGENSLRLVSSSTSALYMLLPEMNDLNNLYVTFKSMYDNVAAGAGTLSLGYLTDPTDGSTFVSVSDIARTTSWTSQATIFTNIPTGAQMTFRYSGATASSYNVFIDDVRISRLVSGDVYFDTICYNANYVQHGFNVMNANIAFGDNTFTRIAQGTAEGSSDTLITSHVYRLDNISVVTEDTICAGQPYVKGDWNLPRPATRTYRNTFRGASVCGCDSTVELHLVVIPTANVIVDTICHNGSYVFRDTIITDPGKYTRSYTNSYGCISTDTLYLMMMPDSVFDVASVCQNDLPYRWQGQDITTAGRHIRQITGPHGCPQTAVLDLTIIPTDSTMNYSICQGGSVLVVDTIISTAGTYTIKRLDHVGGCMITYHVTVTTIPTVPVDVYDFVCEGSNYTGNGINNLPVYADTVVTVASRTVDAQCDSITNVHIRYIPTVYKEINETIAAGETYNFDGTDYTESGDYTAIFHTVEYNCDSVVTLHLKVTGTAVENVFDITIDIVPNPITAGATAFIYGDFTDIVNVEVINSIGQTVHTFIPTTYPIEISNINASGLYNVRLTTSDGHIYIQKLIVK